jgi:hypothetical protein
MRIENSRARIAQSIRQRPSLERKELIFCLIARQNSRLDRSVRAITAEATEAAALEIDGLRDRGNSRFVTKILLTAVPAFE